MADDAEKVITDAMADGKKAELDGETFENHSIPDLVAGLEYLSRRKLAKMPGGGLRVTKIKGNSAV